VLAEASVLTPGTAVEGVLCEEDVDLFTIEVSKGCILEADLSFAHDSGDLDLRLVDPAGELVFLAGSETDDESLKQRIQWDGLATLQVEGGSDAPNSYSLVANLDCTVPFVCPDNDTFEPNESPQEAATVTAGSVVEGIVCPQDVDVFAVVLTEGCRFQPTVATLGDAVEPAIKFLSADGVTPVTTTFNLEASSEEFIVLTDGIHYVRVTNNWVSDGASAGMAYALSLDQDCSVSQLVDPEEPNNTYFDATPIVPGTPHLAGLTRGDIDIYSIEIEAGCTLSVDVVETQSADGELNLMLSADGTSLLWSAGEGESPTSVDLVMDFAGTKYIGVVSNAETEMDLSYQLTVATNCP
jgi:hypothetical protein